MIGIISSIIQIIFLLLKNKFEKDAEEKKRKEEFHGEAKEAINSLDAVRLHALIDKLRSQ